MTNQTLPQGGGSYIRDKDGTLRLVEEPTVADPAEIARRAEAGEAPVEEAVKPPVKRTGKEA
ncbi:MAG: hypothetical protein MUE52_04450 [Tabrizicola sp.]|jgi:hypothetical protein|nr:hypothetical protein [Tabrizicola sp.]